MTIAIYYITIAITIATYYCYYYDSTFNNKNVC